ncbi:MAG: hypothetical protein IJF65_09295 [Clostridia bacterium]|nr:hypothetical protein [Clostridia bacterium]
MPRKKRAPLATKVTFTNNKAAVQQQMEANIDRALTAMGEEAVGLVVSQMQRSYGKPIRQTSTLMRSITHERASLRMEMLASTRSTPPSCMMAPAE